VEPGQSVKLLAAGDCVVTPINHVLDDYAAFDLAQEIQVVLDCLSTVITIDLTDVDYLEQTAVDTIAWAKRRAALMGGSVSVIQRPPAHRPASSAPRPRHFGSAPPWTLADPPRRPVL
jgi:anti-anti-sigma regulatory factor